METLGPASQYDRVARLQTQPGRIGGHVRAALVNNADDTERYRHPLNIQTVRPLNFREYLSQRIRQFDHRLQPAGHRLDTLVVERQPIQHCATQSPGLGGTHILRVRQQDCTALRTYLGDSLPQRCIALIRIATGERERSGTCRFAECIHYRRD